MNQGWIKLYRTAVDHGWLQDHKRWAVWSYCLLKATHKAHTQDIGRQKVSLLPGQFVFGRFEAARDLKMKPATVYKIMKWLEHAQNINIKSSSKFSLVTIVNWDHYQNDGEKKEQEKEHESSNKVARKEHKQECKEEKNEKKEGQEVDKGARHAALVSSPHFLSWETYKKAFGANLEYDEAENRFKPHNIKATESIDYFIKCWEDDRRETHRGYTAREWGIHVEQILCFYDNEYGQDFEVGLLEMTTMIDRYFNKSFQGECDYSLSHFMSGAIRANCYFEARRENLW